MSQKRPKIGLALGSGGAKGWAHIGALEVLQEAQIPIDYIAGTSIGSYVGAILAAGHLTKLKEFALSMDWKKILAHLDIVVPRSGFIDGRKVLETFSTITSASRFEDLNIPLKVVAADLYSGQEVIIDKGALEPAIRASISIPGILTPVKNEKRWLVDGGVVNPLPVSVLQEMGADIIIAIDLNGELLHKRQRRGKTVSTSFLWMDETRQTTLKQWIKKTGLKQSSLTDRIDSWFTRDESRPQIIEVLGLSVNIMQYHITRANLELAGPQFLIQPAVGNLGLFDFDEAESTIAEGRKQMEAQIEDIKIACQR